MSAAPFRLATAGFLSFAAAAGLVRPALAEGASASNIYVSLTTHGVTTGIDPLNRVTSGLGPTYDKGASTGAYHQVLLLTPGELPVPALIVNAANFRSHIKGNAAGSSEGDAEAKGLDITLAPYPRASEGAVKAPYLHITADAIEEKGDYDRAAKATTVHAAGVVKNLTIAGSLVGGKTITYTGAPKPDQVLYDSPTVTITLNQSLSSALISCFPKCVVTPYFIDTNGLTVAFKRADLGGEKMTGQISIGAGNAGGLTHF